MLSTIIFAAASCANSSTLDVGFTQLAFWQILILGIVQGITELLPISRGLSSIGTKNRVKDFSSNATQAPSPSDH